MLQSLLFNFDITDHTQYRTSHRPHNEITAQYIYSLFFHMNEISAFIWNTMQTPSSAHWNGNRHSIPTGSKKKHWGHAPLGSSPRTRRINANGSIWLMVSIINTVPSKITDQDVFFLMWVQVHLLHLNIVNASVEMQVVLSLIRNFDGVHSGRLEQNLETIESGMSSMQSAWDTRGKGKKGALLIIQQVD